MAEPRVVTSRTMREISRRVRDNQWNLMERMVEHDPLWVCPWDKHGRHPDDPPDNLYSPGLLGWQEDAHWFLNAHPDWVLVGDWSEERYAYPFRLTDAGRAALDNREAFDMEPVVGGLVEPGYQCVPLERQEAPGVV